MNEIAKSVGKAIDAIVKAGPFLEQVFGPLVKNGVGIVSDRLAFYRLEQFFNLRDKVGVLLKGRGVTRTRPVLPKIAIPLIEAATLEDDESLHDLWANLLVNAMDPEFKEDIRPAFITILKDLSPIDADILRYLSKSSLSPSDPFNVAWNVIQGLAEVLDKDVNTVELSLVNLSRLSCTIMVHDFDGTVNYVTAKTSISPAQVTITPLGWAFMAACSGVE